MPSPRAQNIPRGAQLTGDKALARSSAVLPKLSVLSDSSHHTQQSCACHTPGPGPRGNSVPKGGTAKECNQQMTHPVK